MGHAEKQLIKRRLWNVLRITFFMIKKGLIKRRHVQEELMKRGKVFAQNVKNLMFHQRSPAVLGVRYYEFSCSNSPAFTFTRHRHRHYFSCILPNSFEEEADNSPALSLLHSDNADILQSCNFPAVEEVSSNEAYDMANGEELGTPTSPKSHEGRVDREAEDFIARFYSQIKFQRQISFLQYEQMLARGAD